MVPRFAIFLMSAKYIETIRSLLGCGILPCNFNISTALACVQMCLILSLTHILLIDAAILAEPQGLKT